ncbi:MAG TPA: pyridoxamine 5'-phosphate oxidase family protein [Methylomirabilota bacterium]|jgi:PPOX class probable F420-dependent enzyme|nr:pyridoxamine 5'-phosphate oxidase family protein [Methylomirabilota bacterium]
MQVPRLSEGDLAQLLRQSLVAKIATTSAKGEIRISPIWFEARDGVFVLNTFEDSALVKNLRANPRCSLLIDSTQWPYIGVHYWGKATVEGPENDATGIGKLFARYVGSVEAATDYAKKLIGWGKRVYVRFRPERSITWDFRQG